MKLNKNLKYKIYKNTVIILPEGENCFILEGLAFEIFNALIKIKNFDIVKNKIMNNINCNHFNLLINQMIYLNIIIF